MTALPGLTPRSPEIIDGPVLVTAAPANTANDVAVPNPTGACTDAADATGAPTTPAISPMAVTVPTASTVLTARRGLCPRVPPVIDITNSPDQQISGTVCTLGVMDLPRAARSSSPQRARVNAEMPQQAFSLARSARTSNWRSRNRIVKHNT